MCGWVKIAKRKTFAVESTKLKEIGAKCDWVRQEHFCTNHFAKEFTGLEETWLVEAGIRLSG